MPTTNKLQVVYKNIDELIPYARNPKKHSAENISQIAGSIKSFGFNAPVLIDSANGIIAGHGRVLAAKKLGIKQVPCVELDGMTEPEKRAYILADNKLAELSGWDTEALNLELEDLKGLNMDLSLSGFSPDELNIPLDNEPKANPYSTDTKIPHFEPGDERPALSECVNTSRADSLLAEIKNSGIPQDEKDFLIKAASRLYEFSYKRIAQYYTNVASPETQKLFEKLALVIIDFNDAIANGFSKLKQDLATDGYEEDS